MNFNTPPLGLSMETYGLLLIFSSALFFSLMGCFMKLSSESGIPSTELVFARAAFQGIFVILFMLRSTHISEVDGEDPKLLIKMPLGKSKEVIPTVIARGLLGGLNFTLKFYSMMVLPLGDAITLFSLHPIITVFMARLFLGEQVRHSHVFAAFSTVTGAVLMAGPTFLFDDNGEVEVEEVDKLGYLTAVLGSFCAAGVLVLIRKAGKLGAYTSQLLFSFTVFGGGLAFALGMTIGLKVEGMWIAPPTSRIYWYLFCMCSIGSIGQLMLNFAGRFAPAGLGSIARSSDILWGYILEMVIFDEIPSWSTAVGVILILIALCTVSYEKMKDEQARASEQKESAVELGYKNMEDSTGEVAADRGEQA